MKQINLWEASPGDASQGVEWTGKLDIIAETAPPSNVGEVILTRGQDNLICIVLILGLQKNSVQQETQD